MSSEPCPALGKPLQKLNDRHTSKKVIIRESHFAIDRYGRSKIEPFTLVVRSKSSREFM
jgi:hypothetical protein